MQAGYGVDLEKQVEPDMKELVVADSEQVSKVPAEQFSESDKNG